MKRRMRQFLCQKEQLDDDWQSKRLHGLAALDVAGTQTYLSSLGASSYCSLSEARVPARAFVFLEAGGRRTLLISTNSDISAPTSAARIRDTSKARCSDSRASCCPRKRCASSAIPMQLSQVAKKLYWMMGVEGSSVPFEIH